MSATIIVVISANDGYWLATDGQRAESHDGKTFVTEGYVCKLHQTPFGLVAKSGSARDVTWEGVEYSTDEEVHELVKTSTDAKEFKNQIETKYAQDLRDSLAEHLHQKDVSPDNVFTRYQYLPIPDMFTAAESRTILIADLDADNSPLKVFQIEPISKKTPVIGPPFTYSLETEFDWEDPFSLPVPTGPITFPSSVRLFGNWVDYKRSDAWVRKHPLEAIHEIMTTGHQTYEAQVGPPLAIVHLVKMPNKDQSRPSRLAVHHWHAVWVENRLCPRWDAVQQLPTTDKRNAKAPR